MRISAAVWALFALVLLSLAGCAGGGGAKTIVVSVSPAESFARGGQVIQFTANVTNSDNKAVTWSLQGNGSIDATGKFTAPLDTGTVKVIATSAADNTKRAVATVNVIAGVALTLDPATARVRTGQSVQFTANVLGSENRTVVWSVLGGDANGTITQAGLYTAPPTGGEYTVVARSNADTNVIATAIVNVEGDVEFDIDNPTTLPLMIPGSTIDFDATVTGTGNTTVNWSVEGGDANGTITQGGVYTAPDRAGTFTIRGTAAADSNKTETRTVTVALQANVEFDIEGFGKVVLQMRRDKAPNTCANFVSLVNDGFYDGTRFHRYGPDESQPDFIQGGSPLSRDLPLPSNVGTGGPGYQIDFEENDLLHVVGAVAMARSQDRDSAGSQFYICNEVITAFDTNYVVFAQVIEGQSIVAQLRVEDRILTARTVAVP